MVATAFGGLFALNALFSQPNFFDRYVCGSPALWWDDGAFFDLENDYARQHRELSKVLFVSMGELEQPAAFAACEMVSNFKRLTRKLSERQYASLNWHSVLLAEENHSTGVAASFLKGLLWAFRQPIAPAAG